ncbi:Integrase-like protein [Gossypium australe]|uniref:Integrase-like protein n=1 Tax=Gossypium australe TaxID=47621 RepID=A0A5B6X1J9_9ROSI|nr:Integrase-like protein [Gossypium australe]
MQEQPPLSVGNIPHENPLFDDADDSAVGNPPAPQLPANVQMARNERTIKDYALPSLDMFRGTMIEDPSQHLNQFIHLCDTFKYNRVTDNAIHLQLFSFSLIDNAFS